MSDGMGALEGAKIRLSSLDGGEVLALTDTHLLHVRLPVGGSGDRSGGGGEGGGFQDEQVRPRPLHVF